MKTKIKRQLLTYLEAHNDGSEETRSLIEKMRDEVEIYDCDSTCIQVDDLNNYGNQAKLREMLGKQPHEEYTVEDVIRIGKAFEELIADDFGENLNNTVWYGDIPQKTE